MRRDRFAHGLGQSLVVWLTLLLLAAVVRHVAVAWLAVASGVVVCILLGQWHQRRARAESAVGSFTGAVLWPVVIAAVILAIGIVTDQRSEYE
ncbi:hypothetical protein ACQP2Y_33385 [Actinoplanes sp. CA-051413]|uniref:hypothetical protein n=1 Tax=Actinoplanes sp. CA-051413 TaxID=3239899 RepID=UPI003D95C5E9